MIGVRKWKLKANDALGPETRRRDGLLETTDDGRFPTENRRRATVMRISCAAEWDAPDMIGLLKTIIARKESRLADPQWKGHLP
jgi:hypothetical protein